MKFWQLMNGTAILRAMADEGGAGAGGAGAGDTGAGDTGAGDTGAGDAGAGDAGTGDAGAGAADKWWEGEVFNDATRASLVAKGWTLDDPVAALGKMSESYVAMEKMAQAAKSDPDTIMLRPGKDQTLAEWMQQQGDMFGVPEKPEGYEIAQPESWPEGAKWDTDLENAVRQIGVEEGIPGAAMQKLVDLHAGQIAKTLGSAEQDLGAATAEMQANLKNEWGAKYNEKLVGAQQAASVIAEAAGLDANAMQAIAGVLKPAVGDAGTMRMFAAIADMMGDDGVLGAGLGGKTLGTTPAEARQQLAALRAPDGDYAKAVAANNKPEIARLAKDIERLSKLATGS